MNMKIVLLRDVKGVGRAHEVVEAKDGHALNYLIPGKFAIAATPLAQKEAERRRQQRSDRAALDNALLAQNLAALAEAKVILKAKANEKGHLYDAIGASEIMRAVKEQARIDLPEDAIRLEKPFKELGTFDVPVSAHETFGKFSICIEAE